MLFNFDLIRRHRNPRDVVNFVAYTMCHAILALHLWLRGKRRSARLMVAGLWDGTLGREGRILKERIEERPDDYRVEQVPAFEADLVLDKQGHDLKLGTVLAALGAVRRRVLIKRPSQFVLLVCYFVCGGLAITDGERVWALKQAPKERVLDLAAFYAGLVMSGFAAVALLGLGLLVRAGRDSSVEWIPGLPARAGGA